MIVHLSTSIKKQFIYLTRLVVTCFLHFSCQVSTDSTLGSDTQVVGPASCTVGGNIPSTTTDTNIINNLDIGHAGQPKYNKTDILYEKETKDEENNIDTVMKVKGNDTYGFRKSPEQLLVTVNDGIGDVCWISSLKGQNSARLAYHILFGADITNKDPKEILCSVQDKMERERSFMGRDTTCLIVTINRSGLLKYANRGDSTAKVFTKDGTVAFKTTEKVQSFNFPCAVGYKGFYGDPSECSEGKCNVESGQTIVTGSDGLWDNLYDEQIWAIISEGGSAQDIAERLKKEAYNISKTGLENSLKDSKERKERLEGPSPFELNLMKAITEPKKDQPTPDQYPLEKLNGKLTLEDIEKIRDGKKEFIGQGKPDDISIIVIKI